MIILSGISMDPYFSEVSLRIVRVASCQDVTSRAEVLLYTLHINQYCILLLLTAPDNYSVFRWHRYSFLVILFIESAKKI